MARIVGTGGTLTVGYQHAGTIARWAVTTAPHDDGAVDVTLDLWPRDLDPFWSQQRPVTVTLPWFGRDRVWRDVVPDGTGGMWRCAGLPAPEVV